MSEQDFKTTFARNLTFMLEQNDMSQADLARSLGVNESTVHSWITAKKSPRMGRVDEMCKLFGCTRSQLTNGGLNNGQSNHYINVETQKIAQEIYEDEDLRALFSAARDASAEDLKTAHDILKALKAKERGEHD